MLKASLTLAYQPCAAPIDGHIMDGKTQSRGDVVCLALWKDDSSPVVAVAESSKDLGYVVLSVP